MSTPETITALYVAIYTKDEAAARRALAGDPALVHRVEFGYPWLVHAVRVGSLGLVQALDEHGADLHRAFDEGGMAVTALSLAERDGKDDIAAYLRSRGAAPPATVAAPDPALVSCLADAVAGGDQARVKEMLAAHPALAGASQGGVPWLHAAAQRRDAALVGLLIERGCDVNGRCGQYGYPPLAYAETASVMRRLLARGAVPGGYDKVMGACTMDSPHSLEMLRLLDDAGAGPGSEEGWGAALRAAVDWGRSSEVASKGDVVEYLRSRGAKPAKAVAPEGAGLMTAIREGDVGSARRLVKKDGAALGRVHRGHTALQVASHYDSVEMVEWLVTSGADVNAEGWGGSVALEAAVGNDNPEVAGVVLERGADPNRGRSVLWAVVGHGRRSLELLRLLERHGADLTRAFVNEASDERKPVTAGDMARAWKKRDVARYLRSR